MPSSFSALLLVCALAIAGCSRAEPPRPPLVANGDFEEIDAASGLPAGWSGSPGVTLAEEDGNRFLRLAVRTPGELVRIEQTIRIPDGVHALEMRWRQRVTGLVIGEQSWYHVHTHLKFFDENGAEVTGSLGAEPPWSKATHGWENVCSAFLVPDGAHTMLFSPVIFHARAGVFEIDDIAMAPASDAELAQMREVVAREKIAERIRRVPRETDRPANWPAELRVDGARIVDAAGNEVILRGVSAGNLETHPDDIQAIKSAVVGIDHWKSNHIRLPVRDDFWFGEGLGQNDEGGAKYRETVDQILTLVANRGAYLVLDLHRFRAPRAEHERFWKDAAARYKNHPAVLFELLNEPHDISWEVWRDGGFVEEKSGVDESAFLGSSDKQRNNGFESIGMQRLLDAVRSTGARNIVIVGGLSWSGDLSGVANGFALQERDGGNGIVYSWHQYNWHTGWDRVVLPVIGRHPVYVGEFGADTRDMEFLPRSVLQEDPHTWVPDMLGFIQKHRLSWAAWCFHPGATPRLLVDWTYEPTPFWGVYAMRALAGEEFEMKRMR